MSSEEEESDAAPTYSEDDGNDVMSPKKKPRLLHRRNLRAVKKGLSIDSFNPDTLTTHTEELKRIERLENTESHINNEVPNDDTAVSSDSMHPLVNENRVIILSDSDDEVAGKKPACKPYRRQSSNLKYCESLPLSDGRLVVNLGHPHNEQDIHLAPQIALAVKPHQVGIFNFYLVFNNVCTQVGGIRFLYDNIIESLSRYNGSQGFGCILAHSMGLGKTLQVIAFIDVFLHYTRSQHVLCVVPINTIQNWVTEFNMWLPEAIDTEPSGSATNYLNDQPVTTLKPRNFQVFVLNDSAKTLVSRVEIIKEWRSKGGVLMIGYEMFRLLSLSVPCIGGNKMAVKKKKSKASVVSSQNITIDLDETEKEMEQLMGKTINTIMVNSYSHYRGTSSLM